MLEFFRKNHFLNSLLLLPYTLLLRFASLLFAESWQGGNGGFVGLRTMDLAGSSALTQNLIAFFLVYIQAVIVNRLAIRNRLANEITLFPGLFYILQVFGR